jgi:hypothetical protein
VATLPPLSDSWFAQAESNNFGLGGTDIPSPVTSVRPNNGTSSSTPASATTPSGILSSLPSLPDMLSALAGGAGGTQLGAVASAAKGAASVSTSVSSALANWNVSRVIFIVLGLLFVAAGIFSFKTGQTIITEFGKGVRDGVVAG